MSMGSQQPGPSEVARDRVDVVGFPALDERFSRLNAFKLRALRACLSAGISPAITGGGGGHVARVKCRLTTLSTVYALREDGEPCTFVVGAHKRDCGDENDHEAAVDRLNLVHSCPEGVRPAYLAEDKAEIETKIAKMEERVREEARRTTPAGATRMPNTPNGGTRRLSSLATPGWGSASKPSGDLDERFPGAFHLRNHVSLLLQAGPVPAPTQGQTFATSRDFLVTVYAYAQQQQFTLERLMSASTSNFFHLRCERAQRKYRNTPGGCCPVQLMAQRADDGTWQIVAADLQHSHRFGGIEPTATPDRGSEGPSKRARYLAPSPPAADETTATPVQHKPATLSTASASLPSADLVSFFASLFPPDEAFSRATTLYRAGLSTTKDLVALLHMAPGTLALADAETRRRDGDWARTWSFVEVQEAVLEAFGGP
ncbi:hypothetical protein DMC30DRAFT_447554 [Rhodotorula diobovata]|uniref:Uncharacterized protein n=1 Tax=Rhodotorula diobovata TaxID=5288 RepID=A0A5C5FUI3_9BASI|nr:hypothetical protein DMC30DRAFT_447554 [Rhodotorula diobovata]